MHHWANLKEQPNPPEPEYDELEKLIINDRLRYMRAIYESNANFAIYKRDDCWPFNNLHWIFFNLHPGMHFSELLPSFSILNKIEVDHKIAHPPKGDMISDLRNKIEEEYFESSLPNK
ncbi:uncharacterized protein LOC120262791 [Dioscorea cayenensis subsp. rotundata]|uniref:Uncharacterized protein LOC120262791 n=1 Tax=Dioscorea cayennensis subsp. rotundata TaxID=55577 RepID=A0AB40BIH7_DIOCR|nr:uncharacterized protein LOC120262791 [Dioscorea cayenensis subsp. rotundata]